MIIQKTKLDGVLLIRPSIFEDFRGTYSEVYNTKEYKNAGISSDFIQDDLSISYKKVLRGMHGDPLTSKLVQCAYGRIYQVVLNCDPNSKHFGLWESFILSHHNRLQVFIPPMHANGFYVLSEVSVYSYKQTTFYGDAKQFTIRWDDPRFGIKWPDKNPILSSRDDSDGGNL